jgi:hypothetical protein
VIVTVVTSRKDEPMIATLLSLTSITMAGQPRIPHYYTVEVLALSDLDIIGTPYRINPRVPGGEQVKIGVAFNSLFSIDYETHFKEVGAFLSISEEGAAQMIAEKAKLAVFRGGSFLRLDDPETKIFNLDLTRINNLRELSRRIKEVRAKHPEIEKIKSHSRSVFPDEAKKMGIFPASQLLVPLDHTLERWALEQMKHEDYGHRLEGLRAIAKFDPDKNIKAVRAMLKDSALVDDQEGGKRFPVREYAQVVLDRWEKSND